MAKLGVSDPQEVEPESPLLAEDFLQENLVVSQEQAKHANDGIIGIIAPPSFGKTTLAATFSDFCPTPMPPLERPQEISTLQDTAWWLADDSGLASLVTNGVYPLVVDEIWKRPDTEHEYRQMLKDAAAKIERGVKAGVIKFLVLDTVSSMLGHMNEYLETRYKHVDQSDKWMRWVELESWVGEVMFSIRRLGIPVIVLFHVKYRTEWISKKATAEDKRKLKERARTQKLPGEYEIELELQGNRAGRWFYKNCSYIFPLKRDSLEDAPVIVTDDSENTVVKHRCKWLDRYEPPNLKQLWKKIQTGEEK